MTSTIGKRGRTRTAQIVALMVGLFSLNQWRSIFAENINWDEFALMSRVAGTIRTGVLQGGGRPGLVVPILIPFVNGCRDAVASIVHTRQLWLFLTIGYLTAFFFLIRATRTKTQKPWHGAAISVALVTLVPVFLRWSLQVRTDQAALFFACWGAVALLASVKRLPWAVVAGALFALGYLSSQKAAYVGALAVPLFALRLASVDSTLWPGARRALACGFVSALAAAFTIGLYYGVSARFYQVPAPATIEAGLNTFQYYRQTFGFRAYWAMLPSLGGHLLLTVLFVAASSRWRTLLHDDRRQLVGAWAVMLIGVAVALFHGGAFPYFWMTLGLFPAAAIGLAWEPMLRAWPRPVGASIAIAALSLTVATGARTLWRPDTQQIQRDAFAFIDGNLPASASGYQTEGALFCRPDPSPFPAYFADGVMHRFTGEQGPDNVQTFLRDFREKAVAFLIANRLYRFPDAIEDFWSTHYVLYRSEVMIPGREIHAAAGDRIAFDAIVAGRYRLIPSGASSNIAIDGEPVQAGGVELTAGIHTIEALTNVDRSVFALAIRDDPVASRAPFYDPTAVRELDPLYPRGRLATME